MHSKKVEVLFTVLLPVAELCQLVHHAEFSGQMPVFYAGEHRLPHQPHTPHGHAPDIPVFGTMQGITMSATASAAGWFTQPVGSELPQLGRYGV